MARWASAIERERAALAVVVGPQDEQHVLDRHDEDQRPQDERHDPEHHLAGDRAARRSGREGLLQGVKRARADVAVDDAERAKRQQSRSRTHAGAPAGLPAPRDGAGWKPLQSCYLSTLIAVWTAIPARSIRLNAVTLLGARPWIFQELGLDESAKDREGRVIVLELGDILDPVDRQPADADRAVPAAVIAGQAMDRPVRQFPTDRARIRDQPRLPPRSVAARESLGLGAGLEPRTCVVQKIRHEAARRLGGRLDPRQEGAEIAFLILLRPHLGCPNRSGPDNRRPKAGNEP